MKFKTYNGESFTNAVVSFKIDGVRAHRVDGKVVSRAGKPLYNIPAIYDVCEVFLGSWEETVSAVRTKIEKVIDVKHLYPLEPIDPRLLIGAFEEISKDEVESLMLLAVSKGYEGLVIQVGDTRYKVKPKETYDVPVTGIIPGKGQHEGKVGALITPMGNVGTGLTNLQRKLDFIGKIIEVEAMSLTHNGKFRHPRFIRVREDKF